MGNVLREAVADEWASCYDSLYIMELKRNESNVNTGKRNVFLITSVALAVLMLLYALAANEALQRDREQAIAQAELNAKVYSGELARDFDQAIAVTEALEEVIINGKGEVLDFEATARDLIEDYIGSIQIAPNGVVTDIYPLKGNEGGLIDLMSDPERGPIVSYGMEHDIVTMQGPFELKQGGSGIAVRNPVFLTDAEGNRQFWGFTIAIIKAHDVFKFSFDSLTSFGYHYKLSATESPISDEYKVVVASSESLKRPAVDTFVEGGCTWRLEVAPKNGWKVSREILVACISGGLLVVLLTATIAALLAMDANRRQLRIMAETDPLTGLFNRKGMGERVQAYLAAHPNGVATEVLLDIDDFKIINDLYGHGIGDEALKNLAKNLTEAFGDSAIVSRTGGDEFGVFLPGMTAEQAEPLIRKASEMDQTFTSTMGTPCPYTISMGYADYPVQASTREELTKNVDSALYNVKLHGKNGCQRYVPGMVKQTRQQLAFSKKELLRDLPGAGFICHAEDTSILYANDDLIYLLECEDLDDFNEHYGGVFQNVIHPDDFGRVMTEREQKLKRQGKASFICCGFRVITKSGKIRHMMAQARFRQHETFGNLFFVTAMERDQG